MNNQMIARYLYLILVLLIVIYFGKLVSIKEKEERIKNQESFSLLDEEANKNRYYQGKITLKDFQDVIAIMDSQEI